MFTIILTSDRRKTASKIKQGRDDLEKISKTYFKTSKGDKILLKPPKKQALKNYQADVVINETVQKGLMDEAGKPDAVEIQVA